MKHTDRNRKNIGNCNWLRRALPVLLSALLLCSLTGCSVRDLHIGQVEVNTGIATAWITPAKGVDKFAIAGGVASNATLREGIRKACEKKGVAFYHPSPILCTDNAAMIGAAGYYEYLAGTRSGLDLNAVPNLKLGER